jgi:uncharacterized protein YfdQ (DUF2303 family)
MLDEGAVRLIQSTAVQANGVQEVNEFIPQLAVPDGISLTDAEHLQKGRSRFRGTFSTVALAEFSAYVAARSAALDSQLPDNRLPGTDVVSAFVNADNGTAEAFFNLGTAASPGHADDKAVLTLRHTAAYVAMAAIAGKTLKQRALAEWLEDWFDVVSPVYADASPTGTPTLSAAIAAIRDITIHAKAESNSVTGDLHAARSSLEEIEARSKKTLPSGFKFAAKPYDGFTERTFTLRLAVMPQANADPLLTLRIVGLDDITEKVGQEFEEKVKAAVPTSVKVYRGTFKP